MHYENPTDNTLSITFDDEKTDEKKIVRALIIGGVVPRNWPPGSEGAPVSPSPPVSYGPPQRNADYR
jgi:hypothetical protein